MRHFIVFMQYIRQFQNCTSSREDTKRCISLIIKKELHIEFFWHCPLKRCNIHVHILVLRMR